MKTVVYSKKYLWCFAALVASLLMLLSQDARADTDGPRVALVVGNADYSHIGALDNPENDARLIGGVLEGAGFEVTYLFNATQRELEEAVVELGRTLRARGPETTGLFYFAGHGVQSQGKNYLMPVDAALSDEAELDLVGVQADVVLRQMGTANNRTNIVILDACRNNPFAEIQGMDANGLAKMNPSPGTFLSYATGPGDVALDGLGQNSPFTAALAAEMQEPGQAIETVFREVRIRVVEETRGIQTPWDTSLLTTDFVFSQEDTTPDAETLLWAQVRDTDNVRDIVRFLRSHPNGRHSADARLRLDETIQVASAEASRALRLQGTTPGQQDRALFQQALQSGARADFEAYLAMFPNGVYAELVRLELDALQ
ncbi:caspase family protein [uncultured Tateyamaria sp.]|uniref:caspase family protein n=1 Tax=uncultured Tateyamaria sp. TaxID=455651 RepID=UPI0026046876|nr:caspase family protein [uncultured Tateyamaria sp.]